MNIPGFRIRIFFADPDKNLNSDPDPGGREKMIFFSFFTFQMILNNLKKKIEKEFMIFFGSKLPETVD